jgi:hypothetical protein
MSILSPVFLVSNINTIGQIISVMILVVFDEAVTGRFILPAVDKIRNIIFEKSKPKFKKSLRVIPRYFAEFLATTLFIFYFFAGYWVLSEYAIVPILGRLQHIILIIVIIFFLAISYVFNSKKMRKRYLDYS